MENGVSLTEQDCHLSVVFLLVRLVTSQLLPFIIYTTAIGPAGISIVIQLMA